MKKFSFKKIAMIGMAAMMAVSAMSASAMETENSTHNENIYVYVENKDGSMDEFSVSVSVPDNIDSKEKSDLIFSSVAASQEAQPYNITGTSSYTVEGTKVFGPVSGEVYQNSGNNTSSVWGGFTSIKSRGSVGFLVTDMNNIASVNFGLTNTELEEDETGYNWFKSDVEPSGQADGILLYYANGTKSDDSNYGDALSIIKDDYYAIRFSCTKSRSYASATATLAVYQK